MPTRMTRSRQVIPSSARVKYFNFTGGLNLVDAALSIDPGECLAAANFECDIRGRYRRVDGYERYDGQTLPSEAGSTIYRIRLSGASVVSPSFSTGFSTGFKWASVVENSIIAGASSGARGRSVDIDIESGDLDSSATISIYFVALSGTFVNGEDVYLLGANAATNQGFSTGFK